ncbi:MAG: PQQ-binding-like beta-propeller repeat protein, partial [Verrucomicrobiales bacterium]
MIKKPLLALLAVWIAAPSAAQAENWPHWRGPYMDGSSDATGLPESFSPTENVRWALDMPGPSAAVPIVWEDRVFLSTVDLKAGELVAWCVSRESGETLWRHVVGEGLAKDDKSNYASPSPVTDGEVVVFFYGNGPLVAFDLEGSKLWEKDIQKEYGEFAFGWTFSSSPLIGGDKLYFQLLQRDVEANGFGKAEGNESFLLAFDLASGKELWKVDRPSEAVMESREAFSSPILYTHEDVTELLVLGGDCLSGHDPETGAEKWRWGTWNPEQEPFWRLVPSPVAGEGIILACAPKKNPVYAVKAGGKGSMGEEALAWVSEEAEVSADVPTPLFYQGRFYILNGAKHVLNCVEPASGKVIYSQPLGDFVKKRAKFETSPTGADGKIYFMDHLGQVFVVAAGDKFE